MTPRPAAVPVLFQCIHATAAALSWPFLYLYYRLRIATDGKYGGNYRQRMGIDLPKRNSARAPLIWVHALSVGETLSAVPLVQALKEERPEAGIVFSGATEAGLEIARKRLASWVDMFFCLPHDFPWTAGLLVRRLKPGLFVLVETDLWPGLLASLKRHGAATALVNARLSPGSFRRLNRLKPLVGLVVDSFDVVFAQSLEDRLRFEALGVRPERSVCEGNLKFDSALLSAADADPSGLRRSGGIEEGRPAWIAGSTHGGGEEEQILRVHKALRVEHPDLLLILAQRDILRSEQIASLCRRFDLPVAVRSSGESACGKAVYLLDTMGELGAFYATADAAFIGGSMVPFGGHNPLEAVIRGTPTAWGPHLFNFREMEAILLGAPCCSRIETREELLEVMKGWLAQRGKSGAGKETVRDFIQPHLGASRRIARRLSRAFALR